MLQYQIRNAEAWKNDPQQVLIKSGLGLQHRALLLYFIKWFGSNTIPTIPNDNSTLAQSLVEDQTTMEWHIILQGKHIKDWVGMFNK